MNQDELDAILQKHKLWLDDADGELRGRRKLRAVSVGQGRAGGRSAVLGG